MSEPQFWPSPVDYQEAVQVPARAFISSELQWGAPVTNNLGLPRPISGTFANVYELVSGPRRWAVKCFIRNIPNLHQRYAKISDHLKNCRLPYFVTFQYRDQGILIRGKPFPLVQMEWVQGRAMNLFIQENLSKPKKLEKLKKQWIKCLADLRSVSVAHGDLQHGNVLVLPNGNLRLIDYDGMWVPALEGEKSHETGHADFQSPERSEKDFNAGVDEFAGSVIHVAICALIRKPSLWQKYDNGDNLLFRRRDYLDPEASALIAELKSLGDREINEKLDIILRTLSSTARSKGRPAKSAAGEPEKARSGAAEGRSGVPAGAPRAQAKTAAAAPSSAAGSSSGSVSRAGGAPSWLDDHVKSASRSKPASSSPPTRPSRPIAGGVSSPAPESPGSGGAGPGEAPSFPDFLRSLARLFLGR